MLIKKIRNSLEAIESKEYGICEDCSEDISTKRLKARKGRNPQTGAEIDIKASKAPKFTPGKALKEAVK